MAGGSHRLLPERTQGTGGVQVQFYIFKIAGPGSMVYFRKPAEGHGKTVALPLKRSTARHNKHQ